MTQDCVYGRRRPRRPGARIAALALALALAFGCGSDLGPRFEEPSRLPGVETEYRVSAVVERGPYLDALLARPGSDPLRFFFPADDGCRAVVRVESHVAYSAETIPGIVRNANGECGSVGLGSLRVWRDRRGRQSRRVLPTGNASYRVVYQDHDLTLVRGRFPYANQIGWAGGWDTLASLPRGAACDALAVRGNATIEFRVAGPEPYRLISGPEPCPIDAFLKPLPGVAAGPGHEAAP